MLANFSCRDPAGSSGARPWALPSPAHVRPAVPVPPVPSSGGHIPRTAPLSAELPWTCSTPGALRGPASITPSCRGARSSCPPFAGCRSRQAACTAQLLGPGHPQGDRAPEIPQQTEQPRASLLQRPQSQTHSCKFPSYMGKGIPAPGAELCAGAAAPGRCQPHTNGAAAVLSSAGHRLGTRGLGTFASEGSRWHRSLRSPSAAPLRWSPRGCSSPRGVSWGQQRGAARPSWATRRAHGC